MLILFTKLDCPVVIIYHAHRERRCWLSMPCFPEEIISRVSALNLPGRLLR